MTDISKKIKSIESVSEAENPRIKLRPAESEEEKELEIPRSAARDDDEPLPKFIGQNRNADVIVLEPSDTIANVWIFAFICILVWLLCAAALAHGLFDLTQIWTDLTPLQLGGLGLFFIGPLLLIILSALLISRLNRLARVSQSLSQTAAALMEPDTTVIRRARTMANEISQEVERLNSQIDLALSRTEDLRGALQSETSDLADTSEQITKNANNISARLANERHSLTKMAETFDAQIKELRDEISNQAQRLTQTLDLSQQKIEEGRASVESTTGTIDAAADKLRDQTLKATQALEARQGEVVKLTERLNSDAATLAQSFEKQTADIDRLIKQLRSEYDGLDSSLEDRLSHMREMSMSAQVSAQKLVQASTAGRNTVEALADAARLTESAVKKRFAEMEDMVKYSTSRAESIGETAARRVQDSLSHTRQEIARIEADMVALQVKLQTMPAAQDVEDTQFSLLENDEDITPEAHDKDTAQTGLPPAPSTSAKASRLRLTPAEDTEAADLPDSDTESPSVPTPPLRGAIENPPKSYEEAPLELSSKISVGRDIEEPQTTVSIDTERLTDIDMETLDLDDDTYSLRVEDPLKEDLTSPDPDADLTGFDPDFVRTSVGPKKDEEAETEKKSWWKNIFSGGGDDNQSAMDEFTRRADPPSAPPDPSSQDTGPKDNSLPPNASKSVVEQLSDMGLAPGAIVDEGTVTAAVKTRQESGANAMSAATFKRLSEPVSHLKSEAQSNPALKKSLAEFATRIHNSLTAIENDADKLTERFESEEGRAFLLCDAALNT